LAKEKLRNKIWKYVAKRTSNFKSDKRGIVYVWAMIFLGMVIYTFTWFTLGLPLMYFIDAIRTSMSTTVADPMWFSVVNFILLCFEIHPIISLVGWFIYGILNSTHRDVDTWRV
jgi:hypothetical protein